jgi:hypothetical protein
MHHVGLASELSRQVAGDRRAEVAIGRQRRAADRSLDRALSLAGATALIGIVLVGPIAFVLIAMALVGGLVAIVGAQHPSRPHTRAGAPTTAPEDPWWAWRVVEPEVSYLRRRAA